MYLNQKNYKKEGMSRIFDELHFISSLTFPQKFPNLRPRCLKFGNLNKKLTFLWNFTHANQNLDRGGVYDIINIENNTQGVIKSGKTKEN